MLIDLKSQKFVDQLIVVELITQNNKSPHLSTRNRPARKSVLCHCNKSEQGRPTRLGLFLVSIGICFICGFNTGF